jgi:hypothetical protein
VCVEWRQLARLRGAGLALGLADAAATLAAAAAAERAAWSHSAAALNAADADFCPPVARSPKPLGLGSW